LQAGSDHDLHRNHPALSAYEKSGFKVLDEKRCTELEKILGVPGFIRLIRELKID
jgi:hypothetical protein